MDNDNTQGRWHAHASRTQQDSQSARRSTARRRLVHQVNCSVGGCGLLRCAQPPVELLQKLRLPRQPDDDAKARQHHVMRRQTRPVCPDHGLLTRRRLTPTQHRVRYPMANRPRFR